jgi:hypothetical protein
MKGGLTRGWEKGQEGAIASTLGNSFLGNESVLKLDHGGYTTLKTLKINWLYMLSGRILWNGCDILK